MIDDAYTWGMAISLANNRLEGALYSYIRQGKQRLKQKPKDYKKKKKAKQRMTKNRRR